MNAARAPANAPSTTALPSIKLREPYRPRQARFLELWQTEGWLVKLYGLAYHGDEPEAAVVAAAKRAAAEALPQPARSEARYGLAIVIVHQGQDACWLLIDWWGHESILHHRLLMASLDGVKSFGAPPPDVTACVWELPLVMFERDAWVSAVLATEGAPDVARYLEQRFDGLI